MTYQLTTLENGLRIASERRADDLSAAFAIAVNVGARHESMAENGLSHLLEHMAFKGTATLNARQIAEAFDLMGGNVNAYTSHEHTVYHAKVLKEYADDALRLLCDILVHSTYDAAELERERQVVLQEIAMHQDSPDDLVFDFYQEMNFSDQPLGRSILGPAEQVARYTREELLAYVAKHYQPRRMVLAAAGAVNHDDVCRIAGDYFATLTNTETPVAAESARFVGGEKTLEKDLEQVQLVLGYPGLAVTHTDYYTLQLFSIVLGGGMSSRLFQEIREQRGLAYSVSAFAQGYQDVGAFGIYAGTTVEHLPELLAALKDTIATTLRGIDAEELLRAKNQLKAGLVMQRESCGAIAEWIARHLHVFGRYRMTAEIMQLIDAVTVEDMLRVAATSFATATPTVTALGPHGSVSNATLAQKLAA